MDREKMIRIKQEKVERVKIQVKRLDCLLVEGWGNYVRKCTTVTRHACLLACSKGLTLPKLLFVVPT